MGEIADGVMEGMLCVDCGQLVAQVNTQEELDNLPKEELAPGYPRKCPDCQPKTSVVHCKKERSDVYIGRGQGCIWGNPFMIGQDGDRMEVIQKYKDWIITQPDLLKKLPELKGKKLGCFCHPKPCHGDVLVELVDRMTCVNCKSNEDCEFAYDWYNLDGDCLALK